MTRTSIIYSTSANKCLNTSKGYLKSSRDATRYYTHTHTCPSPAGVECSQYSTLAKRSRNKKKQREKTREKNGKRDKRKGRSLSPTRNPSNQHHITTQPLPSFFFFPAIHCTSLVLSLLPSYKPESRSPPFLFRLKKPSFFAFVVGGKAVLTTMFWLARRLWPPVGLRTFPRGTDGAGAGDEERGGCQAVTGCGTVLTGSI